MKRLTHLLILLIFCFNFSSAFCQSTEDLITENDWNKIIGYLSKEDWTNAEKLSLNYIKRYPAKSDSIAAPAILRYMYLRCVGAKLGEKQYSKEEALQKVKNMIGKPIITPPKPYYNECTFNCFQLSEEKNSLYSCSSNQAMTVIQIFENFFMEDEAVIKNADSLLNKNLRLAGIIKDIKAEGYAMPRLRIEFEKSFIWDAEKQEE